MQKNTIKKGLTFAVIILFICMSTTPSTAVDNVKKPSKFVSDGNILYVGGMGPDNYTRIQDAIDNATDGDTVFVFNDSSPYYENIIINKSISLVGEDKNTTIIDGNESGDVVSIVSDWVNVSGFTIQNGGYGFDGIIIFSKHTTITSSIASGNRYGIHLCSSYGSNIIGNTIWNNNWAGIYLGSSGNNIITYNSIWNNFDGICLSFSCGNNIAGNDISNNTWYGIFLEESSGNNITGNNISNNYYEGISFYYSSVNNVIGNTMVGGGILIQGYKLEHWNTHVIDISNTVNGKPVIYWKNQFGGTIPTGAGQVILANCTNVLVENQNVSSCFFGIELGFSSGCTITGNIASNNDNGIYLYYSNGNNLTGNTASNNRYGIYLDKSCGNNLTGNNNISNNDWDGIHLYYSSDNTITGNNITNNYWGIQLYNSSSNTITGNNISSNQYDGIYLDSGSNSNTMTGNNISNNNDYGIYLRWSNNNVIYHNNFIENTDNAYDEGNNTWDDGKKGNYWSDYEERYPDAKKKPFKGIWDTPYEIPGGDNKDRYPLIKQWPSSKSRAIPRNTASYSYYLLRFLERFPSVFLVLRYVLRGR